MPCVPSGEPASTTIASVAVATAGLIQSSPPVVLGAKIAAMLSWESADCTAWATTVDMVVDKALTSMDIRPALPCGAGVGTFGVVAWVSAPTSRSSDNLGRLPRVEREAVEFYTPRFLGGITYKKNGMKIRQEPGRKHLETVLRPINYRSIV